MRCSPLRPSSVGWFVTLPAEYSRHLLQALSALTFFSNFAFKSDSGYFAMAAQTKPLLHTWSLSLEWQFYFFMPLIVGLVWRLASCGISGINAVLVTLQIFAALSLAWCLWASQQDATGSSFFSLQARAWEPLAGGLIAAARDPAPIRRIADPSWLQSPIVAVAGWVLVAACVVYPLPEARWPGVLTILPILGSAAIIAARQGSREGGLLGATAIQRVGDWSYSIYLWHWPVWVFALSWLSIRGYGVARHAEDVDGARLAGARCDFLPLCRTTLQNSPGFLDAAQTAGRIHRLVCAVGGLRIGDFSQQGFSGQAAGISIAGRTGEKNQHATRRVLQKCELHQEGDRDLLQFRQRAGRAHGPSAILWGDSFANQYLDPISCGGVRPWDPWTDCDAKRMQGASSTMRQETPAISGHAGNSIAARLISCWRRRSRASSCSAATGATRAEISALTDRLLSAGKTVVLIMPLLNIGFDLPQRLDRKPDPRR